MIKYIINMKFIFVVVFSLLSSCAFPIRLIDNIQAIQNNCVDDIKSDNIYDGFHNYLVCFNKNIDEFSGDYDYDLAKDYYIKSKLLFDEMRIKIITPKNALDSLDKEFELFIVNLISREIPRLQYNQEYLLLVLPSFDGQPQNAWIGAMKGFYQGQYYALRAREAEYRNYLISKGY